MDVDSGHLHLAKKDMDIHKQKEAVHSMALGKHMQWLDRFAMALSAALLALGLYTKEPFYFMFMIVPLLMVLSTRQTGPHIRAASEAIRSGTQSGGEVTIEVDSSSDSEKFFVTVASKSSSTWRFEFIPLGWTPIEGQTRATLYTLRGLQWPALIEVKGGIMYPRYKPMQVSGTGGA